LALQVLLQTERGSAFAHELLDRQFVQASISAADRRLSTQLVNGVLRRRGTLDALLASVVDREPQHVEAWLWNLLRLGAFQLVFLSHVPPHAAIHETVELAAVFRRERAKGFVNGVLRSLSRLLTADQTEHPAADTVPVSDGSYRRLARPVLPDPATDPVKYLASGYSLPDWLARRWYERNGWEECIRLGFWFAEPPSLWLRCNPLRTDRATLQAALAQAGVEVEAGEEEQALQLRGASSIRELPGYEQGWFTVQDAAAMRVAPALKPKPGSRVLDLCAAPGGKTTHLAELMGNRGKIIACDVDDQRLQTLHELAARLGIGIIETCRLESNQEPPAGPFDAVLVDVPCSNTGVLGRRPEVRWRLKPRDLERLAPQQTRLLEQAGDRVRPRGAILYSTCSI
jgi:16S rRNA (cytosine967-C5)-methyltransferase